MGQRLGQHFLTDPQALGNIVDAVKPGPNDRVLEIGPGRGALTTRLLQRIPVLDAVELDQALALGLQERFGERLRCHVADCLTFDYVALAREYGKPLRIVGNLPYYLSSPLLFRLYAHLEHIEDIHVMVQREFAERLAARPGSRHYGRLTVMSAPCVQARILFHVPPRAFAPPPKVASSFVRLSPLRKPPFPIGDRQRFAAVVAKAFQQRRKTMRHTFKSMVDAEQLQACGIEPNQRPEELSAEAFARLAELAMLHDEV